MYARIACSISADRVDEIPSGPEVLPDEVALPFPVHTGEMDCALPLDEPDHLGHRILRRDRDQHVHMIGHQVPCLDLRLFLRGQPAEHLAEVPPKLQVQRLCSALRDEDDVVFCSPTLCGLRLRTRPSVEFLPYA